MIQLNLWINQPRNQSKSVLLITWYSKCLSFLRHFELSFLLLAAKGIQLKQTLILTSTCSFTHITYTCMHTHSHSWFGALHLLLSPNPLTPPNHPAPLTKHQSAEDLGPFTLPCFLGTECLSIWRGESAEEGRSSLLAGNPLFLRPDAKASKRNTTWN